MAFFSFFAYEVFKWLIDYACDVAVVSSRSFYVSTTTNDDGSGALAKVDSEKKDEGKFE